MEDKPSGENSGDKTVSSSEPKPRSPVMKVVLGLLIVIAIALVVFVAVVMMQPDEFHVSRSTTINAAPAEVLPYVNNFHNWNDWSPWVELDPNAEYSFPGPDAGEGAEYHWDGNDDVGAGFMKILESSPNENVQYELNFIRPYEDTCKVEFQLQPEGDGTKVTWEMYGENDNFMAKMMCLFMDIDAMVGNDFEKGLKKLKQEAEQSAPEVTDDPAFEDE